MENLKIRIRRNTRARMNFICVLPFSLSINFEINLNDHEQLLLINRGKFQLCKYENVRACVTRFVFGFGSVHYSYVDSEKTCIHCGKWNFHLDRPLLRNTPFSNRSKRQSRSRKHCVKILILALSSRISYDRSKYNYFSPRVVRHNLIWRVSESTINHALS